MMRNLKKTLSLVIAVLMCFGIFGIMPSYAEENMLTQDVKDAIEVLRMFDVILPDYYDYNVNVLTKTTRADFACAVAKLMNYSGYEATGIYYYDVPQTHWAYKEISYLTQSGILDGSSGNLFKPDDNIKQTEAYKIILSALGYKEYAQYNGGYPTGYLMVADKTGLSDRIAAEEYLTLGDMFKLLYNAMITEVLKPTAYGSTTSKYEVSDDTVMSIYYDVYYAKGNVTGADCVVLDGSETLPAGYAKIEDVTYKTDVALGEYLGENMKFFYHYDEGADEKEILWAKPTGNSNILTVTADNDASFNKDDFTLTYYEEGSKNMKKLRLDRDINVIYNGGSVSDAIDEIFKLPRYTAKFIEDRNGKYASVIVRAYENMIVESVDALTSAVYGKAGYEKLTLCEDDYKVMKIYDGNGAEISFSGIVKGNILSVYMSKDKQYLEVRVSGTKVNGKISGVSDSGYGMKIEIDGKEYDMPENKLNADFSVGDVVDAYLDFAGEIAYIEVSARDDIAVYLINAGKTKFSMEIKLLDENNKISVYECSSNVRIDGISYKNTDEALNALYKNGRFAPRLALIKTNADGMIKSIDTSDYNSKTESSSSLSVHLPYKESIHTKRNGVLGLEGVVNGSSVIFSVPSDDKIAEADDSDFYVMSVSDIPEDGRLNIETYKTKEKVGFEQYVVVKGYKADTVSLDGYPVLIQSIYKTVNSAGESVDCIKGYQGTASVTLLATSDISFSAELLPGMIINIAKNREGYISGYSIAYDYRNPEKYKPEGELNKSGRRVMGYVHDVVDGVVKIGYNTPDVISQVMYSTNIPVMIYDTSEEKDNIRIGTIEEARTYLNQGADCSKVFMVTTYFTPRIFIVFN